MKKKNIKKEQTEQSSLMPFIICLLALILGIIFLPKANSLFFNVADTEVEEKKEEKDIIPTKYQCSYGPTVDSFYNYIKYESVMFAFDNKGNVKLINLETKYQATSLQEYSNMLQLISFPQENVVYDSQNYVVTTKEETTESTKFPKNYKELKQYLSTNQYTCVEE